MVELTMLGIAWTDLLHSYKGQGYILTRVKETAMKLTATDIGIMTGLITY